MHQELRLVKSVVFRVEFGEDVSIIGVSHLILDFAKLDHSHEVGEGCIDLDEVELNVVESIIEGGLKDGHQILALGVEVEHRDEVNDAEEDNSEADRGLRGCFLELGVEELHGVSLRETRDEGGKNRADRENSQQENDQVDPERSREIFSCAEVGEDLLESGWLDDGVDFVSVTFVRDDEVASSEENQVLLVAFRDLFHLLPWREN